MSSTIKVDNIQNQCGANIINESSNTITIGASGDTVSLASGASQTGFGRTGTVDWQTGSIKTSGFTAANGEGYFCNTSGGAFTVTLPASPSAGDIVAVADYTRTFGTNKLTIGRNSQPIGGITQDAELTVNGQSATFVYVDGTEGWINVQETQTSQTGIPPFIAATGGTITECGDFRIHTFTGPGTFEVTRLSPTPANNTVGYQVVAGGGAGGAALSGAGAGGGGGGAGGFREGRNVPVDNFTASPLVANAPTNAVTVTATSFPITVGAGGAGAGAPSKGSNGSNSSFSTITSTGGGAGGTRSPSAPDGDASDGGSGGGGGYGSSQSGDAGSGNTPPVTPSQGNDGANFAGPPNLPGGGGGAGSVGGPASTAGNRPDGGDGVTSSITGSPVARAGGGAGPGVNGGGTGGPGGGADGTPGASPQPTGNSGTANTGGGGGGLAAPGNPSPTTGGSGGSGIVIIRYKFQ